jgi:hypothetical protein
VEIDPPGNPHSFPLAAALQMRVAFRYSLRTFLVAVIGFTALTGVWVRRSLDQKRDVRILEGIGLQIVYAIDQQEHSSVWAKARAWLASRLGKDWVSAPIEVRYKGIESLFIEDLPVIARLKSLRAVSVGDVDDEGLATLARLPRIEKLRFSRSHISRRGLVALANCRLLQELSLGYSSLSPAAAQEFERNYPHCRVTINGDFRIAEYKGPFNSRPDRTPTPDEKTRLETALQILEEKDPFVKYKLVGVLKRDPKEINAPAPGLYKLDPKEINAPDFGLYKPGGVLERDRQEINTDDPGLRQWLDNQPTHWGFRIAIQTLGRLGLADAIPALERVARDESLDWTPRIDAVYALSSIPDRRIIPILIDLLEEKSGAMPSQAAWECLVGVTRQSIGWGEGWDSDPNSEARRGLVARWKKYWKENADVVRPGRGGGMGIGF